MDHNSPASRRLLETVAGNDLSDREARELGEYIQKQVDAASDQLHEFMELSVVDSKGFVPSEGQNAQEPIVFTEMSKLYAGATFD